MNDKILNWVGTPFVRTLSLGRGFFQGRLSLLAFFLVCVTAVFLNFAFNMLSLAPSFWYESLDRASQSLVLSGITHRNEAGSGKGMNLGRYNLVEEESGTAYIEDQFSIFEGDLALEGRFYKSYYSQYGLQVPLLAPVDGITMGLYAKIATLPKVGQGAKESLERKIMRTRVNVLHVAVSLFNAAVLAAFLAWIYAEISPLSGICSLFAVLASGWLTVFGHNFYWIIGFWFLPVVAVCWSYFLMFRGGAHRRLFGILGTLLFGFFIYLKCLMGYEYLSTVCIAACVPVVYYSFLRGESLWRLSGRLIFAGVLAVAGFLLAAQSHLNQIALYHPGDALTVLSGLVFKSTLPVGSLEAVPSTYHEALSFNPVLLLAMYIFLPLNQNGFFIPAILPLLIGGVLAFRILFRKDGDEADPKARALAIAALFSIAAPLSWYILAKAHSARHFHYSFVLWYLPTIFWLVSLVASRYSLFVGKKGANHESISAETR